MANHLSSSSRLETSEARRQILDPESHHLTLTVSGLPLASHVCRRSQPSSMALPILRCGKLGLETGGGQPEQAFTKHWPG